MKPSIKFKPTVPLVFVLISLGCFTLSPIVDGGGQSRPSPTPTTQDVNVVNTPNVNIVNPTTNAVPVKHADDFGKLKTDGNHLGSGGFGGGYSTTDAITIITVPAGQRLIIEYVSVFATMLPGQKLNHVSVMNSTLQYGGLPISAQGSNADGSRDYFVAGQLVHMDFGPGDVSVLAERDSTVGENPASVTFTISGYFVDCPDCAP